LAEDVDWCGPGHNWATPQAVASAAISSAVTKATRGVAFSLRVKA
jgi:hypothetical protein